MRRPREARQVAQQVAQQVARSDAQPQPREQAENHRPLVTVAKGPRPGPVLFGLISIVVAAYVIIDNLGGSNLDLRQNLPAALGAVGALLLLVGLVGVVTSRHRR